ncbi:MAG: efflux RND transporter periplasmic adaptor subunit [Gammaproteobacteria bacterium]|nr:efflux RND transporter periplasmic adaptor subunit [Gammaproteobacteria bacterium]
MRKRYLGVLLIVAGLLVAAGGFWFGRADEPQAASLVLHGNVDIREVELAFNASEHIDTMTVQEGERVTKGQQLATLHTARLALAVDLAEAQVAAQQDVLDRLEAGSRPEEIRRSRAELDAALAEARNRELEYQRLRKLAASNLASREQADNAKAAADASRARAAAAEESHNLAVAGPRSEEISAARSTLRAYEAQLALARESLADAVLTAPADGVIQDRLLEPGDMATPQKPVYTLALMNPVWIRAYVDEPDLGKIAPGMPAEVTTDSFPEKRYRGWVGFISPTAEFTPKSVETARVRTDLVYQVRIYVCNPQNELRLGMPASVEIALDARPPADATRTGPVVCEQD